MFYPFFDYYYLILIIPAMIIAGLAQANISSTYAKYRTQHSRRGMTGADVARAILRENGLSEVYVTNVSGHLTDHYDPRDKTVRLSDSVYNSTSIAAIGVAAHEVGHAIQHANAYLPLTIRNAVIPVTNIGTKISIPLIIAGVIFSSQSLIDIGIIAFSFMVIFQFVTLPVEFNASSRAVRILSDTGILEHDEVPKARKVLSAAAMTYVAALIVSIAQLLRLILLYGGRRRD